MSKVYRILVVDDNEDIAQLLHIFFTRHGHEVAVAGSGEEAVGLCRRVRPHVVLMDINLPDETGFETFERLRSHPRTSHVPVIFLTKRAHRTDKLAGLEMGADDYITKPFNLSELILRVHNAVGRVVHEAMMRPSTGLPDHRIARRWVADAHADYEAVRLEFRLEHAAAYREVYGQAAHAEVERQLADLVLEAAGPDDQAVDFIGHFDAQTLVMICSPQAAEAIGEEVCQRFNAASQQFYPPVPNQRGQSKTASLMRLVYAVHHPRDEAV